MFINALLKYEDKTRKQTIQILLLSAKFIVFALSIITFNSAYAHEFWIQPEHPSIKPGDQAIANLLVGQALKGETQAYISNNFRRFELYQNGKSSTVSSRLGDIPAVNQTIDNDGLLTIKYESHRSVTDYENWEKFVAFLTKNDLDDTIEQHKTRKLEETGFKETFIRYSKALLKVGSGKGNDIYTDMPFEWVINSNPYTGTGDISMTLLADGKGYSGALAHIFVKEDSGIREFTVTTDADGKVSIPRTPGFFLINAVKMQIPPNSVQRSSGAIWESLWASHTFTIEPH